MDVAGRVAGARVNIVFIATSIRIEDAKTLDVNEVRFCMTRAEP